MALPMLRIASAFGSALLLPLAPGCSWHWHDGFRNHEPVGEIDARSPVAGAKPLKLENCIGDLRVEPSDDELL